MKRKVKAAAPAEAYDRTDKALADFVNGRPYTVTISSDRGDWVWVVYAGNEKRTFRYKGKPPPKKGKGCLR